MYDFLKGFNCFAISAIHLDWDHRTVRSSLVAHSVDTNGTVVGCLAVEDTLADALWLAFHDGMVQHSRNPVVRMVASPADSYSVDSLDLEYLSLFFRFRFSE